MEAGTSDFRRLLLSSPAQLPGELPGELPGLPLDNYQLLETGKMGESTVTVLEGSRGMGKTTLLLRYHDARCRPSAMRTHYLDLSNNKYQRSIATLKEIFDENEYTLFLLDCFEEFASTSNVDMPTLFFIIQSSVLKRRSSLVVATRKSGVNVLYHYLEKIHHHYVIDGFSDQAKTEYFESVYMPDNMKRLFQKHILLADLCKIPIICEQLLSSVVLKKFNLLDATLTEAVYEIMLGLMSMDLSKSTGKRVCLSSLHNLSGDSASGFKILSKLAIAEMMVGTFDSLESASLFLSSFFLRESISSLKNIQTFNLIDFYEYIPRGCKVADKKFWFMSPYIRDFLSGFYLHDLPLIDQLHFLYAHAQKLIDRGYHGWLHYFYGLTVRSKAIYSPTCMIMGSMNELLLQCLDLQKSFHIVIFFGCLMEAREVSLWKKLRAIHDNILDVKLSLSEFTQVESGLSAMVSQSGIKEWVVECHIKHENIAATFINETKHKMSFDFHENCSFSEEIRLRPKVVPSGISEGKGFEKLSDDEKAQSKQEIFNLFCCKAIREILQRVLQLYSKLKLKGNSSAPSYLSFLSCDCFRIAMETCVKFEPVVPMHYLSVQGTNRITMAELDLTAIHLSDEHDGKALELVILLRPTLRRMKFVLPNGKEEFEIKFSSKTFPETLYVDYLSSIIEDLGQAVQCMELTPMKCERVFPTMPIPTKNPELVGSNVVLPSPSNHPINPFLSTSQAEMSGKSGGNGGSGRQSMFASKPILSTGNLNSRQPSQQVSKGKGLLLNLPAFPSSRNHVSSNTSINSKTKITQQSLKSSSAMRPGTVTYTSIPELLSTDRVYPLPDESLQIQIGGNGVIFHGQIGALKVAIKKTAYRTKELAVMSKVKHSNILQLLGFMWGEENPAQRRRYFCYHIMPQMTGKVQYHITMYNIYV